MAVIVSNGATSLSTTNGFYRSDANNPVFLNGGAGTSLGLPLTTTRTQALTFANSGKCMGVILGLTYSYNNLSMYSTTVDRGVYVTLQEVKTPVTMTIASPCVVTFAGHGFSGGEEIAFSTTGALPTGITALTYYYVKYIDANTFNLALTPGGSNINTSGSQSGTHSLWVTRASCTKTHSQLWYPLTRPVGSDAIDFSFGSGYTIDTSANKWRLEISQTGTSGTLYLILSDTTTNMGYITYSDNLVTPSSGNDLIVVKDIVTVDKSFVLKAYTGTGYTTNAVCGICCRSSSSTVGGTAMLVWENPPSSSYTLTLDAYFQISSWSGVQIGSEASRISAANKAVIKQLRTPTLGTAGTSGFTTLRGGFEGLGACLWAYGEDPGYLHATLTADCAAGSGSCTVDDATEFVAGDIITLGKENTIASGNSTVHTVSGVVGNVISFSPNIAGSTRLTGGTVVRYPANMGVEFVCDASNGSVSAIGGAAALTIKGAKMEYTSFQGPSTSAYLWTETSEDILFERCVKRGSSTSANFTSNMLPGAGQTITYRLCHGLVTTSGMLGCQSGSLTLGTEAFSSGKFVLDNCHFIHGYTQGMFTCSGMLTAEITDCSYENWTQGYGFTLSGVNLKFKNNFIWGDPGSSSYCAVLLQNLFSVSEWSGNKFDKNWNAIYFNSGYYIKGSSQNDIFGSSVANTYDIQIGANAFIDWQFDSPTISSGSTLTFIGVPFKYTLAGSEIRITDYDDLTNSDYIYLTNGDFARCGDGLTDTTVHTAGSGKFCLRQQSLSSTNRLEWSQNIPTGDISGKDMSIGVWCKINNSAYWSGTNQLPRLTVNYDDGTIAYAQAAQSTSWQYLSVPFSPSTSFGQITVTMSSMTDASGSNAYVYFDDFSALFPAGHVVSLGGLDLWANAKPIVPGISTSVSALDVWAADPTQFGNGTVGAVINETNIKVDDASIMGML